MKPAKQLTGPIASGLSTAFAGKAPTDVVKGFARHLFANARLGGPAFDPRGYALYLGLPIARADINSDGLLADWPGRSCKILLRNCEDTEQSQSARNRENFTIAHEIGHFLIREQLDGFVPRSLFSQEHRDEEQLCNIFAAELLMPSLFFRQDCEKTEGRPRAILRLSETYQVSLEALLYKLIRAIGRHLFAAIWELCGTSYDVLWAAPEQFERVILCHTGNTTVERAFEAEGEVEGRDALVLDGRRMRWSCVSIRLSGRRILTIGTRPNRLFTGPRALVAVAQPPQEPIQLSLPLRGK